MRLDFLADGAADCPLLRLWSIEPGDFFGLREAFVELANGAASPIAVDRLSGVHAAPGVGLMALSSLDPGLARIGAGETFEWRLQPRQWLLAASLVEPLADGSVGFQWLCAREARYGLDVGATGVLIPSRRDGGW